MPSLQRPLVLPHLSYSHQEREKYITALLKKYRLVNIPKADEYVALPPSNRRTMAGRRPGAGRKANDHKNKVIRKLPSQQQTYLYLLTRKLQSLLKGKDGLDPQQRRQISTSLSL